MGPVNLRAEQEAAELEQQMTTLQSEKDDLVRAIARLRQGISSLNREGRDRLLGAFEKVNKNFQDLFVKLFGGGRAHLALATTLPPEAPDQPPREVDPLEAGLEVMASPPGKKLQTLSLLSGGEQALTALALLFAVFLSNPAPICVLDEVDAPLDDANVDRFCTLLERDRRDHRHALRHRHASPHDDGAHGPPVRRHHGRARRLAARLGRPRRRRAHARHGLRDLGARLLRLV